MEVDCEGCAGCCIDWRPLAPEPSDHERRGPGGPLDDTYNLVPLTRDDVHSLVTEGLGDACIPRFFEVSEGGVSISGLQLAAIDGRPVFYLGLRTPPKPVGPFDAEPQWLNTCIFLDPTTLQCRIHDSEQYPTECATYPGHNLSLGAETECERVTDATGEKRLLDDEPPADLETPLRGVGAIGWRLFVVRESMIPSKELLESIADDSLSRKTRADFVATAAASSPGTTTINQDRYETVRKTILETTSWTHAAAREWTDRVETEPPDPHLAHEIEDARGAPGTPGWN